MDQPHDLIPLSLGMLIPLVTPVQGGGYVGIRPLSPLGREAISSLIPNYPYLSPVGGRWGITLTSDKHFLNAKYTYGIGVNNSSEGRIRVPTQSAVVFSGF